MIVIFTWRRIAFKSRTARWKVKVTVYTNTSDQLFQLTKPRRLQGQCDLVFILTAFLFLISTFFSKWVDLEDRLSVVIWISPIDNTIKQALVYKCLRLKLYLFKRKRFHTVLYDRDFRCTITFLYNSKDWSQNLSMLDLLVSIKVILNRYVEHTCTNVSVFFSLCVWLFSPNFCSLTHAHEAF